MRLLIALACMLMVAGCGKQEQGKFDVPAHAEDKAPDDAPWIKVSARDFDAKVLHSNLPALVYFDTDVECRTVDDAFLKLRHLKEGKLAMYYVDIEKYPKFAKDYGVGGRGAKLVLFDHGREIRSTDAREINGRIQASGGFRTEEQLNDAWFREVARFVDPAE
jgi:hypothetical protein